MSAYNDNPKCVGNYVDITCDDTRDRRSRGAQIAAVRVAYQGVHGVRLVPLSTSYDEAHGFLHRTRIRYRIER